MECYSIYCTEEQTRKAFELGAPLQYNYQDKEIVYIENEGYMKKPTAEQMIGWLEEQNSDMRFEVATGIAHTWHYYVHLDYNEHYHNLFNSGYSTRKEATLAAIDVALDYLSSHVS